jgi:hypothetical protein
LTPHVAARRAILAAAIFTFPLVASCDGDPEATPSTSVTSTTPTPSPASSSPADPKQVASDGAIAGYKRWDAGMFRMRQSGGHDTSMLTNIAIGNELALDRSEASQVRRRKVHAVRNATILSVRAMTFGGADAHGVITSVTLSACVDVTHALSVDASGRSVVAEGRPPRQIDSARMQLVDGTWKASLVTNRVATAC